MVFIQKYVFIKVLFPAFLSLYPLSIYFTIDRTMFFRVREQFARQWLQPDPGTAGNIAYREEYPG